MGEREAVTAKACEGVHIVAVWRDGGGGDKIAATGMVFMDYWHGCAESVDGTGPDAIHARGLYRVTWRGQYDPPEVERISDLPDPDALCRGVTP